jgi:soluble lytic murein transglycosylase-like protein
MLTMSSSLAVAAQRAKSTRTAQVIVLQSPGAPAKKPQDQSDTPLDEASPDGPNQRGVARPTAAFQGHDLSRRWVEFEMSRKLAPAPAAADDPFTQVGRPDLSLISADLAPPAPSIQIPAWMLNGSSFAAMPTSFAPGCASAGYRPAGFLRQDAERRRQLYFDMMSTIACEYGIPVGLFDAMIIRESGYQAGIYSAKNAFGLTQLMPGTAADLGVNRYDVVGNLRGGAQYLRQQLDRFGQVHLALAAYNAGPGRVRDGVLPRIAETQDYVENVLLNWRRLASLPGAATSDAVASQPARAVKMGRVVTVSSY